MLRQRRWNRSILSAALHTSIGRVVACEIFAVAVLVAAGQIALGQGVQSALEINLASPAGVASPPSIGGREIGCSAAQNWRIAQVLRARGRTLVRLYASEGECARAAAQTLSNFLNLQAAQQEDVGAAAGMRAYYSRIAIAKQLQILDDSFELIDLEEKKQQALMEKGLAAGTDLSSFARQRIDLQDQRLQLQSQDLQLRSLLAQLTGFDYACADVHQEPLEVRIQPLDCIGLQQAAMQQRQDLRGWKLLAGCISVESAPEFAKMLPTLVGGWSLPVPSLVSLKQLLCKEDYSCLAADMKRELDLTVQMQSEWICQAVDEKCRKLELGYARIDLARQTSANWIERIAQLEKLAESGNGKPELLASAKADLLKARSQEVARRLDARLAEIDLAEAVGCLASRCCHGQAWLPLPSGTPVANR
ncbi:MAG: hypothetical protein R3C53_23175 [Pirellulaceae bacterium]